MIVVEKTFEILGQLLPLACLVQSPLELLAQTVLVLLAQRLLVHVDVISMTRISRSLPLSRV